MVKTRMVCNNLRRGVEHDSAPYKNITIYVVTAHIYMYVFFPINR